MENSLKDKDQDVLLIKEKGKDDLQAAGMDEKGNVKRLKPNEGDNPDLLRIDKNGTILENFLENFMRQTKNPTQFEFFRVPAEKIQEVSQKLGDAFKSPEKPENKEFINMHRVEPDDFLKKGQQAQQSPAIDPGKVLWALFEKFGITRETLEKTKEIDKLLDYKKTGLMPVTIKLDDETPALRTDGRFSLRKGEDGTFSPVVHLIRHKPELEHPYFGVRFTEEDKKNLLATGNLGRIMDAEYKKGEKTPVFISIDRLTNELVAFKTDRVKIPERIKGVDLNDRQKMDLASGKAVWIEDMTASNGKSFSAYFQFNAEKQGFGFRFENDKQNQQQSQQSQQSQDVPKTFRKKELTEAQRDSLREGKTVHTGDLYDKNGKKYTGYITLNKETHTTDFMFPPDYRKALAAGTVIPDDRHKTQVEVNNNGKTNEATKNLKEPLQSGQTQPTEKQAKKQQQDEKAEKKKGRKYLHS